MRHETTPIINFFSVFFVFQKRCLRLKVSTRPLNVLTFATTGTIRIILPRVLKFRQLNPQRKPAVLPIDRMLTDRPLVKNGLPK